MDRRSQRTQRPVPEVFTLLFSRSEREKPLAARVDVTRLKQNYVKSQKMEYLCKCSCAIGTSYCDHSFDVTTATYSLPDLYIPKMKNALFVAPESNSLSCAYAVLCPYLLIPTV